MMKKHYWKFMAALMITALIAGVGLVPQVTATVPNSSIVVDCSVNTTTEWAPDEYMGPAGGGYGTELYLTWDATNLYVGIKPGPIGDVSIYIDNGAGGMMTASLGGTHQIAASGGYEFSYSNVGPNRVIEAETGGSWADVTASSSATSCIATGGTDVEWAIPWTELGVVAGTSRVTILVTSRSAPAPDNVFAYWPVELGRNIGGSTPSFEVGFIFPDPINANGYSPAPDNPTAVSLSQFSANNSQNSLLLLAGVLVLVTGFAFVLRFRNRKQNT
jgi:LPXTG-motif cell wall-anchored protein